MTYILLTCGIFLIYFGIKGMKEARKELKKLNGKRSNKSLS